MLTTVLDLLALVCLVAFAYLLWPPAALAVAGVALLMVSYRLSHRPGRRS